MHFVPKLSLAKDWQSSSSRPRDTKLLHTKRKKLWLSQLYSYYLLHKAAIIIMFLFRKRNSWFNILRVVLNAKMFALLTLKMDYSLKCLFDFTRTTLRFNERRLCQLNSRKKMQIATLTIKIGTRAYQIQKQSQRIRRPIAMKNAQSTFWRKSFQCKCFKKFVKVSTILSLSAKNSMMLFQCLCVGQFSSLGLQKCSLLTLFPFDLVAKDEKGKVWPNIHVNNTFFPKHEKKVPKVL